MKMNEQKPRRKEPEKIDVCDDMIAAGRAVCDIDDNGLTNIYRHMEAKRANKLADAYLAARRKIAFAKFEEKIMYEPMSGCWIWGGALGKRDGYGHCRDGEKMTLAHRFSYLMHKGEIPEFKVIDHKCRNRACVNPDHLRAITQLENIMCGTGEAARNATATHCVNGHSLHDAYIKVDHRRKDRRTYRHCKTCAIEQSLTRYYGKSGRLKKIKVQTK